MALFVLQGIAYSVLPVEMERLSRKRTIVWKNFHRKSDDKKYSRYKPDFFHRFFLLHCL